MSGLVGSNESPITSECGRICRPRFSRPLYLLDLADGVTRMMDRETTGHRTPAFGMWWANQDRSAQQAIHEMRTAELKRLERRTHGVMLYTNVRDADYGDTVTKFAWVFVGGKFHGQEVLPTLRDYLDHTEQLIDEAERLMDPQVTS